MKLHEKTFERTSTITPARSIAMTVDMNSLTILYDVLSGLYSDKEMAVLRELSTNARDSHIEAGVTRPIEVTLPVGGALGDNDLIIEDFGVGMDLADIEEVYSKYGASTKRDSDDYNGVLGLGSKSPLAYVNQYTFIGTKNGVRTTVSVSWGDAPGGKVPVMNVLSEKPTTDGNGVKLIIPARQLNYFKSKAERLFRFWEHREPGQVLVDGEAPKPLDAMKVTDNIYVTQATDSDYIVMGGVPYPVYFDHKLLNEWHIVAYVEMGAVAFTPSREKLDDTPGSVTNEAIAAILAEYEGNIGPAIQAQVEQAATPKEAFAALANWRKAMGVRALGKYEFRFRNKVIPLTFDFKDGDRPLISNRNSEKLSAASRLPALTMETAVDSLMVFNYGTSHFTAAHKKKLLKYCRENEIACEHFVMVPGKLPMTWLDKSRVVEWEVIRQIKLPRTGGQVVDPSRPRGAYDLWVKGEYKEGIAADKIDTAGQILWVSRTNRGTRADFHGSMKHNVMPVLKEYKRGPWTVVIMTDNRVAKFLRDFPKAKSLEKELGAIYRKIADQVTEDMLLADWAQNNYDVKRTIGVVDAKRCADPIFGRLKGLLEFDLKGTPLKKLDAFASLHSFLPYGMSRVKRKRGEHFEDPLDKYPLLTRSNFLYIEDEEERDHIYEYMNTTYRTRQAKLSDSRRDYNGMRG